VDSVRGQYAAAAQPVAVVGFPRLPGYFSADVLQTARTVSVTRIPFPPIVELGLDEFAGLMELGLAAVTFDDLIFVHQSLHTERVHFHELVHVLQWRALGVDRFMLTYGAGVIDHGYAHSPLEAIAYDLQSQFDRGLRIAELESTVAQHALETAASYAELFRIAGT